MLVLFTTMLHKSWLTGLLPFVYESLSFHNQKDYIILNNFLDYKPFFFNVIKFFQDFYQILKNTYTLLSSSLKKHFIKIFLPS